MIRAFYKNRRWFWHAYVGGVLLVGSLYVQVYVSVIFNKWNRVFLDMMQRFNEHSPEELYASLYKLIWIVVPIIPFSVVVGFFMRLYTLWWRKAITLNYLPRWEFVTEEIEGASQGIQDDAARFRELWNL